MRLAIGLISGTQEEKIIMNFISSCLAIALIGFLIYLFIKEMRKKPKPKTDTYYNPNHSYSSQNEPTQYYPYEKKMLLSKAEYTFYNILKKKCDENSLLICPKVRMEDFINVTTQKNKLKYRGYIRSRHIDFMICNSKLYLLAGIELDDNSHKKQNVAEIDKFKDNVFRTIKLPLFRIQMSKGMYENQIDNIINIIKPNPYRPEQKTVPATANAGENSHPETTSESSCS